MVEFIWKMVSGIIDQKIGTEIWFHDVLHGFRMVLNKDLLPWRQAATEAYVNEGRDPLWDLSRPPEILQCPQKRELHGNTHWLRVKPTDLFPPQTLLVSPHHGVLGGAILCRPIQRLPWSHSGRPTSLHHF